MSVGGQEAPASLYSRLKPGPGRSPREVEAHQRNRAHRAVIELVTAEGYGKITIRKLARLAGLSTETLYGRFGGKDGCVTSAYASVMDRVVERIDPPSSGAMSSEPELSAAIRAIFSAFAEDSRGTRFALVEIYEAGAVALADAGIVEDTIARSLRAVIERQRCHPVPASTAGWITAGILRLARRSALEGVSAPSEQEIRELCSWSAEIAATDPRQFIPAPASGGIPASDTGPSRSGLTEGRGERDLILTAASRLGVKEGYWHLTPSNIRRAAGVSRACFDRQFADLDDCYLTAVASLAERYWEQLLRGPTGSDWRATLLRRGGRLRDDVLSNAPTGRLAFVGILAPGAVGLRRRERLVTEIAARLGVAFREELKQGSIVVELDVAALWASIADGLDRDRQGRGTATAIASTELRDLAHLSRRRSSQLID
jgi:AcrR family transcriptional regulator